MKTLLTTLIILSLATAANSVRMYNTGKETIDFSWNKCFYKDTWNTWRVAINVKGMCPYSITYYPESGTWSR